ncbi:putative inactive purple acid phosphatase 16 isoform X1 [Cucumis melo var. makuwa]|uniref:Inactive purple acid phosphatase 16 isoform X1 n=2 Tax=Cucumis melo TaxID=3656 RepID=A0A5A7UJG6_CUCMM|nr:putative inactive purple acid phosphatase 16 isoform X1 [Cucumis melo var. makuwa]TYK25576.1 putative inactive purple acid phosphatase 16 isoform X1 [Cucumis melo var. makuwa]
MITQKFFNGSKLIPLLSISFTYMCLIVPVVPGSILRFRSGSPSFNIALFADLHFGEDAWTDWGPLQDANSSRLISTVLSYENPDLVVYLGDVITANNIPISNASLYWDQAISPTKAKGIPWATVFGNHDDAPFSWPIDWFSSIGIPPRRCRDDVTSCSGSKEDEECEFRGTQRLELMKKEIENSKLSQSRNGPKNLWPSVSNYYIQITPSSQQDLEPPPVIMNMYFLDSGGGSYPQVISSAQVEWLRQTTQHLNPHFRVPEIVFWHIPSGAYEDVAPLSNHSIQKPCVGSINMEKVAAQQADFGIMSLLEQRPSVKAVFVGHNHGLDWCCPHKTNNKLWLCFARHSGYGGYGDWPRGARIIQITHQPFSLKSWIRMEDGQLHSEIILSTP